MTKPEEIMTAEQIKAAVERIQSTPAAEFLGLARELRSAGDAMEKIAHETDGHRRLELLLEVNDSMGKLAAALGG